ncbi:MAG: DNA glycosylase [Clostridia bacterium]
MNEIILKVKFFNLKYTLECGQCFRWKKLENEEDTYVGVIFDRVIKIKQKDDNLIIRSNKMKDLAESVIKYFDLKTDYEIIEKTIMKYDNNIKKAVKNTSGTRILNQSFFEILISYIISANNNIPRIAKSVDKIAMLYGKEIIFEDEKYYLFPSPEDLKNVTIDEYRKCGVGFRDTYIYNVVKEILNGKLVLNDFVKLDTCKAKEKLLEVKGVGPKVADCILLFALGRKEVFPIDVWVERVMQVLYFKNLGTTLKKIDIIKYAQNNFKEYAGIVQQHLFYNIREKMIEY